jgi:hypothetical protein
LSTGRTTDVAKGLYPASTPPRLVRVHSRKRSNKRTPKGLDIRTCNAYYASRSFVHADTPHFGFVFRAREVGGKEWKKG